MTQSANRLALGIVGLGKIATDQHLAAIAASREFTLAATADPHAGLDAVAGYPDIGSMLAAHDAPKAVAVCTPPQHRYRLARCALEHGCHVLLEKPPGTTVGEVEALTRLAAASGLTLFCAWHSQFAAAVESAREYLAARRIRAVRIEWREDVRVWHPGQTWIWRPGGFGVFDPGINALSIAVRILPQPFFLTDALLHFPENCQTPIAAELEFLDAHNTVIEATFDFLQTGAQIWNITVETDAGTLVLSRGGTRLAIDDAEKPLEPQDEYPALYAHFASLIRSARSDANLAPLRLVADALLRGRRVSAPPFRDPAAR
ncbi:MAG TPA: Gfo/Idh/MocA family oxidoreductase [Gammaproteobacteria bacterium]|nr:Gfo/Idh/MocA family oxidoreductase [Gammaproteobacteria bacterium]